MEERDFLKFKLMKLKTDIKKLEDALLEVDIECDAKHPSTNFVSQNFHPADNTDKPLKCQDTRIRDLAELSCKASDFQIEKFSRILRVNPGELYVYDCWIQGATSSVKFEVKFSETVQGSGDECGRISEMKAEVIMVRDDPECLSEWVTACTTTGDIPLFVNGVVEFSSLAQIRRHILQSLYKRSLSRQLGCNSFQIQSVKDKGVLVDGAGPDGNSLFSITWKITFCEPTKSMMPSFDLEFHQHGEYFESLDVFSAFKKPFLKEEVLPQLWEAVAEALTCFV